MDDLGRWLGDRLSEDRQAAKYRRGIFPSPGVDDDGTVWLHVRPGGNAVLVRQRDPVAGYDDLAKLRNWATAEYGWTRERVLQEIDAKQQIVRWHYRRPAPKWDVDGVEGFECATCDQQFPCLTLRLLALPYADRPGYREEWRP